MFILLFLICWDFYGYPHFCPDVTPLKPCHKYDKSMMKLRKCYADDTVTFRIFRGLSSVTSKLYDKAIP